MVLLSVGYIPEKCDIYKGLNELSTYFKSKGVSIGLVESDSGEMHFIKCIIGDEDSRNYCIPDIKNTFNVYAANILYQAIVDNFQLDIVNKMIDENYYYFKAVETNEIAKKCIDILNGTDTVSRENYLFYINRKNKIVQRILEYINDSYEIILEGFLRFRLKDFNSEIGDVVDKVVEEYLIEREYNEFIKLLKYFVEIQESRIEIINIVIKEDGSYSMYGDSENEITDELIKELTGENLNGQMSYDDLLVSTLITVSPKYIIIHNVNNIRNKEIVETIKNVFGERVKVCTGCKLCLKQNPIHKV